MSVLRQFNWLGQARVDVPHIRSVESSICADFDVLAGQMMAGEQALVLYGFEIGTLTVGTPATDTTLVTANGLIMHPLASESGTIFAVPSDQANEILNAANSRLTGSFTANTTNFIGIDLIRQVNDNIVDTEKFIDPTTGAEVAKEVSIARTLDYRIVVSTQDFSTMPGIAPVAKIVTDSANLILSVTDCRSLFFRLGSGGSIPDSQYSYSWPGGRTEIGDNTNYSGGDKQIGNLKTWCDAVMTRLWEANGGEYWYSATADRNVKMVRTGTPFAGGDWFEWDGTNLHWKGLKFVFDNSTGYVNTVNDQTVNSTGLTNLADGDCIYVDLVRSSNATVSAVKAPYATLGTPTVPGSRFIIAWRVGTSVWTRDAAFVAGTTLSVATTTTLGTVKLSHAATTPAAPIVYSDGAANVANGVVGLNANVQAAWTATSGTALAVTATAAVGVASEGSVGGGAFTATGTGYGIRATGSTTGNSAEINQSTGGIGARLQMAAYGSGTNPSGENNLPLLAATGPGGAGNPNRWTIDRVGFPAGRCWSFIENWMYAVSSTGLVANTPAQLENPVWSGRISNVSNTISRYLNSTYGYPVEAIKMQDLAGNSNAELYTTDPIVQFVTDVNGRRALSAEFDLYYETDGDEEVTIFVGFKNDPGTNFNPTITNNVEQIGFYYNPAVDFNDWFSVVTENGQPAVTTNLVMNPVGNVSKLKIIIDYSTGVEKAYFYIDGDEVGFTDLSTVTPVNPLRFCLQCYRNNGNTANHYIEISDLNIWFNRWSDPGDI